MFIRLSVPRLVLDGQPSYPPTYLPTYLPWRTVAYAKYPRR